MQCTYTYTHTQIVLNTAAVVLLESMLLVVNGRSIGWY